MTADIDPVFGPVKAPAFLVAGDKPFVAHCGPCAVSWGWGVPADRICWSCGIDPLTPVPTLGNWSQVTQGLNSKGSQA